MSWLEDDGRSPLVTAVEDPDLSGHRQALHVRVGPVYHGDKPGAEPGIWVEYQEEYMNALPMGPVLLDEATWKALNRAVARRLRAWRKRKIMRRLRSWLW